MKCKRHWIPASAHYCPEYFVMPAEAGIQRLKSLDYSIHPCMLPFGPALGCSNLLQADLVQPKTCWNDGI